jgi:cyanophycinase
MINTLKILFITTALVLSTGSRGQNVENGNLVIVGGGLEANNKSIFNQLIGLAGGADKAVFAVIPSAGGAPVQSFMYFRSELISYGVKPGNIHLIPVALIDDDSTTDVNESEWKDGGSDPKLAEIVRKCTAVWFTGGDQLRITKALVRPDGSKTPVLEAVWDVYRTGGVIGGTSAGAAIMSEVMIGAGTSIAALNHGVVRDYSGNDLPADSGVLVTRGLGVFPHGLMDQHFNPRARIGRLAVTLMDEKKAGDPGSGDGNKNNLGFGVDENTALIYYGKENKMKVAGAGGVTMLNTIDARAFQTEKLSAISNLLLNYLEEGDMYDFETGTVTPAEGKQSTRGKENHRESYSDQQGILSPNPATFRDLYTIYLADNTLTDTVRTISSTGKNIGFMITLCKTAATDCFSPMKPDRSDRYTVTHIRMDIIPVNISITPMNHK